ncbi:LacI family DNA-binding transcriptional regulator [Kineosporia sp. J2-2]|uniref:LacI family DNA-binding transcriptional regulator n=1 Tax=Kineosporia corallincola TaxID=2835133 RepID=A0ABS5TPA6_9ACTN|nr:LacI family DNA-binding transcriptional regulator [Kineosporia corallincola]MBT0772917.1 LacI family DNA-binding transcriptional regulator [Kineosporia corallincola]
MMARRVTMRDVAEASGVSRATVGFVLNNTPNQSISPATRERVEQVARDLGYMVDGIARAMREGSSRIVVLNIDASLEGNYSRSYIRGLDDELARHDHILVVKHGHPGEESTRRLTHLVSPRAVIDFAANYSSGRELADGGWDDGMAAHTLVQIGHLHERGHERLAMALPPDPTTFARVRERFSREAAERLGLPPLVPFTLPHPDAGGVEALNTLLENEKVTAVAGFTDELALRVLRCAHLTGRTVPGDLAVIGYDATEYAALSSPALTTVYIDAEAHGRRAARQVAGAGADHLLATPARVVVRESA